MRNKKGQFCAGNQEIEENIRNVNSSPLAGTLNQPPTIKSILMVVVLIWLFNLFSPMVKEEVYLKLQSNICTCKNSTISTPDLESNNATRRKEK
jgi:hypothetical protein